MTTDFTLDKFSEEQKYRVLFEGKIKEHVTLETAKQNVASLLKMDPQKMDPFFSGQTVTLKTDVSFEDAEKLKALFDRTGAVAIVRSMEAPQEHVYVPETPEEPEPETEPEKEPEKPIMYSDEAPPEVAASPYEDEEGPKEAKSKTVIPLVVAFLIIASLVYFIVFRKGIEKPKTEAEFKEATVIKLANLNSVMQVAITLTINKEITFPADWDDIFAVIKDQESLMPKEAIKQGDELLIDGWGYEMIYKAKDNRSYIFRSAGSDGIFETEDDLTLIDGKIDEGREIEVEEALEKPQETP